MEKGRDINMVKYLILILFIFLSGCTGWAKETKFTYGLMMTATSIDLAQTLEAVDDDRFYEANQMANGQVIEYVIITNAAILVVAQFLPDDWRKILFAGKAGVNAANVWHNYEQGVRF